MTIDTTRLVQDLAVLASESRALKAILRATWWRPMADEQRKLARIRRQTTDLCVLRAFARGRLHRQNAPAGEAREGEPWLATPWHRRVAERVAKDYAMTSIVPQATRATPGQS